MANTIFTSKESTTILEYLEKHEYATLRHVIVVILWKTGMQRSSLYALEESDFATGAKPTPSCAIAQ